MRGWNDPVLLVIGLRDGEKLEYTMERAKAVELVDSIDFTRFKQVRMAGLFIINLDALAYICIDEPDEDDEDDSEKANPTGNGFE